MRARYPDCDGIVVRDGVGIRHSTKQTEDAIGWALQIEVETLAAAHLGLECCDAAVTRRLAGRLASPVLVIHGTDDAVRGYDEGEALGIVPALARAARLIAELI